MFATRNGTVKKTELLAYNTPIKADGIIAINIRDDDELLAVRAVDPDDEIIMVSRAGLTVRFAESDARSMGRDTTGVRGMDVGKDGQVIAMDVARDDMDLLVVTENGYGKRTQIGQYRKTNRGAKGVKTIGLTEKKGGLAGALVVREHQELVFISVGGMVQRTSAGGISQQGRSATGVRVMNLKDDDLVSAVALVVDTATRTADEGQTCAGGPAAAATAPRPPRTPRGRHRQALHAPPARRCARTAPPATGRQRGSSSELGRAARHATHLAACASPDGMSRPGPPVAAARLADTALAHDGSVARPSGDATGRRERPRAVRSRQSHTPGDERPSQRGSPASTIAWRRSPDRRGRLVSAPTDPRSR